VGATPTSETSERRGPRTPGRRGCGTFRTPSGSRWITSDAFGAAFRSNRPSPSLLKRSRRRAAANGIATILRMRLGRLQREFPDITIARISIQELEDFLSRMKVEAETRNTHRRDIRTLCFVSYGWPAPKMRRRPRSNPARRFCLPIIATLFGQRTPRGFSASACLASIVRGDSGFCGEALSCRPISRRGGGNSQEPMARA
jgi:hypothetical protein